jgi:hypothetical protein
LELAFQLDVFTSNLHEINRYRNDKSRMLKDMGIEFTTFEEASRKMISSIDDSIQNNLSLLTSYIPRKWLQIKRMYQLNMDLEDNVLKLSKETQAEYHTKILGLYEKVFGDSRYLRLDYDFKDEHLLPTL